MQALGWSVQAENSASHCHTTLTVFNDTHSVHNKIRKDTYRDVGAFSKVRPRLLQLRFGVSAAENRQKRDIKNLEIPGTFGAGWGCARVFPASPLCTELPHGLFGRNQPSWGAAQASILAPLCRHCLHDRKFPNPSQDVAWDQRSWGDFRSPIKLFCFAFLTTVEFLRVFHSVLARKICIVSTSVMFGTLWPLT